MRQTHTIYIVNSYTFTKAKFRPHINSDHLTLIYAPLNLIAMKGTESQGE
jgi:hypothetical protein